MLPRRRSTKGEGARQDVGFFDHFTVGQAAPLRDRDHHLDNLDSKLGQLRNHRHAGAEGLQYVRALGRTVYFDRPEDGEEPAAD